MMTVDDYLAIPDAYGRWLGGLRWSANGEAVEYATTDPEIGLTFAMSAQIDLFLEGLATEGRTLHFAYVLHLLHLLGDWKRMGMTGARGPSQGGARGAGPGVPRDRPPVAQRGALCAVLCRDIPNVPDPPRLARVRLQLSERSPMRYAILRTYPGEVPPLEPSEFETVVRERLRAFSPDALTCWLRHGRGPVGEAGEAVARVVPKTLGERLTELESRPRLRAAAGLVARLAGALALPPRRLAHAELPLGGYSDVTNRGQPEQILPGQFALDMDEFLRRFAERELLYFHREEPHTPTAKELVLLIDQGVRTWGDVRVVLAAGGPGDGEARGPSRAPPAHRHDGQRRRGRRGGRDRRRGARLPPRSERPDAEPGPGAGTGPRGGAGGPGASRRPPADPPEEPGRAGRRGLGAGPARRHPALRRRGGPGGRSRALGAPARRARRHRPLPRRGRRRPAPGDIPDRGRSPRVEALARRRRADRIPVPHRGHGADRRPVVRLRRRGGLDPARRPLRDVARLADRRLAGGDAPPGDRRRPGPRRGRGRGGGRRGVRRGRSRGGRPPWRPITISPAGPARPTSWACPGCR